MSVVALIPAYQAAGTVGGVVRATQRFLREVIVVDDGSSDATARIAREAGAQLLELGTHRGKGAALRRGFAHALDCGRSAVITLDADGQHDPAEIPRLIERWRDTEAGIVIGSRAGSSDAMTPIRRFGNRFSRGAVSLFAGIPVSDPQSGFRLYAAALLRAIRLRGEGYELESEIVVKAARAGFAVESVDIHLAQVDGTETSHYRPWRDTARICWAVVRSRVWNA
ncbi:MAG TPA: glycosyltransferase family 2 protein [Candidatus Polarisedimenticolaceae bacterium]|nr:glycosyltransferase family 2 protein [Candidatus Polarisedimenticolaceae bacterium]